MADFLFSTDNIAKLYCGVVQKRKKNKNERRTIEFHPYYFWLWGAEERKYQHESIDKDNWGGNNVGLPTGYVMSLMDCKCVYVMCVCVYVCVCA